MKTSLISLVIMLFSVSALADGVCEKKAIQTAQTNSYKGRTLYDIESLPVAKDYLVSYQVTMRDQNGSESSEDIMDIILMKSSCSIVSLKHHL